MPIDPASREVSLTVQPLPTIERRLGIAPPEPSPERRGPERTPVLIPAIAVCDGSLEYRCVLRDMSEKGAKIGIPRRYRLPRQFRLVTGSRPDGFPVKLAWQRGDFAGLLLDLDDEAAETA